jgi:hypothetical protein
VPESGWSTVVEHTDRLSAEASIALLQTGQVPSQVITNQPLPGSGTFAVQVPTELLHRARWLLDASGVSEAELVYLATHELPDDSSESQ